MSSFKIVFSQFTSSSFYIGYIGLYPQGAPNDGFLLNLLKTFFKAMQRTFIPPEMHS